MSAEVRILPWAMLAALAAGSGGVARGEPSGGVEALEAADGSWSAGVLRGDASGGFEFAPADRQGPPARLEPGMTVRLAGRVPDPVSGLPPFRLELGLGQRLSGRLVSAGGEELRLGAMTGEGRLSVARPGVAALVQRPGESQALQDGFEAIDTARWAVVGEPDVVASPRAADAHALRLPAGGASLTHRLGEPFAAGRLEVAFYVGDASAAGQQWFVDLTFQAPAGRETVRAVLGWSEETFAVESPSGPALAVQRLARSKGWHRLSVRFGPERTEVAVDGDELAHGKGPGGPLAEVRLATYAAPGAADPGELAGVLDDLRLARSSEPTGPSETDATQDELRMTSGDQVFGSLLSADAEGLRFDVDGRPVDFPWSEVSGVYLKREPAQGKPVEGLLVRAEWRTAPGGDARDLDAVEGALEALTPNALVLRTPYAGAVTVPRDRAAWLRVLGRGRRVVIDPTAHHLGDEISMAAPALDPPQPEGGTLERAVVLDEVPAGDPSLVLDVVQVVGEAADLPFSALVKKGELRTNVKVNGEPFDYLNRHIATRNDAPERIRLPIPQGLLRPGKNVIRFEQAGVASDPNYLDDLGILTIALEFTNPGAPR